MIDPDIHLARALLVDGNPLLRNVTAGQLRDTGVGEVQTVSDVRQARLLLEQDRFDIVVCSRDFEGRKASGQDLLDELRRENLLPHSTVFLMLSEGAVYHQVVEAAESALDGIVVRPCTTAQLARRLHDARHRKRELAAILRALDSGQTEVALTHAIKRFQAGLPYATYCGRLAAELMMTLHRPQDSRHIFEKLGQTTGQAWARLGVARAELAAGRLRAARSTVEGVLDSEPSSADAHDLIGRLLVEQCDFDGALQHYCTAAELTPGCLLRAQHAGALSFYQGRSDQALKLLERTLGMGIESKLFDALSLLLMALLRLDAGQAAGVTAILRQLQDYSRRFPQSRRLQHFETAARVLSAIAERQTTPALAGVRELSARADADDFDLESATVVLALWARLPADDALHAEHEALLSRVAMRFCVSRPITEVLIAAARRAPAAEATIRGCQARIAALAEQAMERALAGDAAAAATELLAAGETHLNAKLIEMAGLMARRTEVGADESRQLCERAAALLSRCCGGSSHIAGIQRSGRSPGGLQLRGRATTEAIHAAT